MITHKERVLRAMKFDNPDRIPVWHFNHDQTEGDILRFELAIEDDDGPRRKNEWGYHWRTMDDGTMGQPDGPVISDWDTGVDFRIPEILRERRLRGLEKFMESSGDHYLLAGMGLTGFTTYTFLRGFVNAMIDLVDASDRVIRLLDSIFTFESELIDLAAEEGFDGVHFQDDWGTQDNLIISPELWRNVFKPRYRAQFGHAHKLGLDVWFHSCGNILDIVPDFHEIGVDVMNISQPNAVDLAHAGGTLRGRQCFMAPVSYQTTSITGTREEIFTEAERLYRELGTDRGGFIGYVKEYSSVGMKPGNYQSCIDAFRVLK
ncbi:uroporphyrinogen decarboxylase family protein [Candidatus Latescibacterota bacterium]